MPVMMLVPQNMLGGQAGILKSWLVSVPQIGNPKKAGQLSFCFLLRTDGRQKRSTCSRTRFIALGPGAFLGCMLFVGEYKEYFPWSGIVVRLHI